MFNRPWISSTLREFVDERILGRTPLRRLDPGGPKNLRDSEPPQTSHQKQEPWPVEDEKQAAELASGGKPLPALPEQQTTLSSDKPRGNVSRGAEGCRNRMRREDSLRRKLSDDALITLASVVTNDEDHSETGLPVPVRAFEMPDGTHWPGHAIIMCNSDFLARLTHILKACKACQAAKRNAELEKRATDSFALKLRVQIAKCEIRLQRLDPEIQLAKQYNVFDNATSGPSLTALKLEKKLETLKSFLERATFRCAETLAALEKQSQRLRAVQAAVNADFEKALSDADMLGDENGPPSGVQAADVVSEYKAFCSQNGITWDGDEAEPLPESLMVGAQIEEVD
jgi:hypothetical protein